MPRSPRPSRPRRARGVVTSRARARLRLARNGSAATAASSRSISARRQEREDLEALDHVGVVGVEPELVERVGAGQRRVEPDGVALALAELGAVAVGDQRRADRVDRRPLGAVDEVGAAGEVAPLVAAAGLQHAAVLPVELEEVEALQDLVAELGVADALVGVEARARRHPS